nr:hypothetical protein [Kibdelosporangium sp. MJ126-NF4]CEL22430.1 hypothetical protein [Kibdelosporangium sp. MJ126-NF4]CTQ89285.1 hypothetical protein [Kibdelosporangium sp. MJ126-NF4]
MIVLDPARVEPLLDAAAAVKQAEAGLAATLADGGTLSDGTNLAEHVAALERGEPSRLSFT